MNRQDWRQKGRLIPYRNHEIFCTDLGQPAARPVIFLHGFPTSSYDYWHLVPSLERQFRLLFIDFLGFGFSDKPPGHSYSLFEQADIVQAVAAASGVKSCHLVSHDMGNSVALELIRRSGDSRQPISFWKYVMLNGSVLLKYYRPLLAQRLLLLPLAGEAVARLMNKRFFFRQFRTVFAPDKVPPAAELEEMWDLIRYKQGTRNYARLIRYLHERRVHEYVWLEALRDSRVPVKLIWGLRDPVSVPAIARGVLEYVPDATLLELEESGHYPQIEMPARVAAEIASFLSTEPNFENS